MTEQSNEVKLALMEGEIKRIGSSNRRLWVVLWVYVIVHLFFSMVGCVVAAGV